METSDIDYRMVEGVIGIVWTCTCRYEGTCTVVWVCRVSVGGKGEGGYNDDFSSFLLSALCVVCLPL